MGDSNIATGMRPHVCRGDPLGRPPDGGGLHSYNLLCRNPVYKEGDPPGRPYNGSGFLMRGSPRVEASQRDRRGAWLCAPLPEAR